MRLFALSLCSKVTFDDDSEVAQERKIEAHSSAITQILKKTEARHNLALVFSIIQAAYQPSVCAQKELKQVVGVGAGNESDERVRKNMQIALAKKLQERGSKYRGLQKEYMQKLQRQKAGASGGSELDFLTKPARTASTSQISVGFTQQQLQVRNCCVVVESCVKSALQRSWTTWRR